MNPHLQRDLNSTLAAPPGRFRHWSAMARRLLIAWAMLMPLALIASEPSSEDASRRVDFNRDIRPILSNNCLQCHGPDEQERQGGIGGLRLDVAEEATMDLGGYAAVVPGDLEASELIRRITTEDEGEQMPPADFAKRLDQRDIEILETWIAEGADFARHWAYTPPQRPRLPTVHRADWPRNEIDLFILRRLEAEGLEPSPEADRPTLIRRLSLDLTGLPPTPDEVDRFLNDSSPDAYEQLVNRLLKKKSYGEHWARQWLDLARYADSAGYADDPPRTIWAYRDYVIQSLNNNKPFDQFTREQLAGDLFPEPTDEQLIATAFHRNTLTNNEGGTNDEEFRNEAVVDRVNTTMAVWMGTTMACAQCHTHKYDPITQEEYFRFFAIFNHTADADRKDEAPVLELYTDEQKERREKLRGEAEQLKQRLSTLTPELAESLAVWDRDFPRQLEWQPLVPDSVRSTAGADTFVSDEGTIRAERKEVTDSYTVEMPAPTGPLTGIRLETVPDDSLPSGGAGHGDGNFVISRLSASVIPTDGEELPGNFNKAYADYSQDGFRPQHVLDNPDVKTKGWAVGGAIRDPHALTLILKEPLEVGDGSRLRVTIEQLSQHEHHTLGSFRLSVTGDPRVESLVATPAEIVTVLQLEPGNRTEKDQTAIAEYYVGRVAPELQNARERLATVQQQLAELKPRTTVPVMRELPEDQRRKTFIQYRGNYLDVGPEVEPGLPTAFHAAPSDRPVDRLTLADWLMADENPLVGRVVANRYWETLFGIGIVTSSEEFGSQGELPTHPELLDWLATELPRRNWDLKSFLTLLVTSSTYRQASHVTPELYQRDPENRLLARGPRFRLSAESIRDQALFVSGLLSEKMHGEPARPPQPSLGLTAAFGSGIDWKTSDGEDRYRRGLYTTWRRSNPYPSMVTFDAPNREVCTVQRGRTNTPLQALVTLNDPVYVEAAQTLARRIMAAGESFDQQIDFGVRLCLARPPSEMERTRLLELWEAALDRYGDDPALAREMAGIGPEESTNDGQVIQHAAWTVVGNVLLNLDEMFMKR